MKRAESKTSTKASKEHQTVTKVRLKTTTAPNVYDYKDYRTYVPRGTFRVDLGSPPALFDCTFHVEQMSFKLRKPRSQAGTIC